MNKISKHFYAVTKIEREEQVLILKREEMQKGEAAASPHMQPAAHKPEAGAPPLPALRICARPKQARQARCF